MPEVHYGHPLPTGHNKWRTMATTELERINIQIRRRKWGLIGHTLRKTNCNVTKKELKSNPEGKRSPGRPRNSWRRTVDDEQSRIGYPKTDHDGEQWFPWTYAPLGANGWRKASKSCAPTIIKGRNLSWIDSFLSFRVLCRPVRRWHCVLLMKL